MKIKINKDTCIGCGKCVKVCPSMLFEKKDNKAKLVSTDNCIVCGHCVAICPTDSIMHSDFPAHKIHKIDREKMATASQLMELIKARRSNRLFSKESIPEEYIEQILEAAHRAPTASNLQLVRFTVITDPEKIKYISDYTISVFAKIANLLSKPIIKQLTKKIAPHIYRYVPVFKRIEKEMHKGNDLVLRGATCVILIHTSKHCKFGCQDSNLAYQNASLMAESLSVAHFYMGFVCSALKQKNPKSFYKKLGIKGEIHAAMALAMPLSRFEKYIDK